MAYDISRRDGSMLAREVMLGRRPSARRRRDSGGTHARHVLLIYFFRLPGGPPLTQFRHFLGFPVPKDKSHFFVNHPPVHTSHFVNHCIRLLLGFVGRNPIVEAANQQRMEEVALQETDLKGPTCIYKVLPKVEC